MILGKLVDLYDRLSEDPEVELPAFGYSEQKIAFAVVLKPDGSLFSIDELRVRKGKQMVPTPLIVPGGAKPSGSGINPGFLWDNPAYLLGYRPNDEKPERTEASFAALRQRHLEAEADVKDEQFSLVCRFLESWHPQQLPENTLLTDLTSGFGVFQVQGVPGYVHNRPAVRAYWQRQIVSASEKPTLGQCLITGREEPLARLHDPKIKGVRGAQTSGAAIVSFNLDAFSSYGKEQSFNAPTSEQAAFKYATALNYLLSPSTARSVQIGDATTVFWTERPTPFEDFFCGMVDPTNAEDQAQATFVQSVLERIAAGKTVAELGDPSIPFYVLGLSPNASRLSVRFWHVSSLGEMVERLRQHYRDLRIAHGPRDPEFPTPYQLLRQTAREAKGIPPLLGGALMRAILLGGPYPPILYGSVLRRIRTDREVNSVRAAVLKATILRQLRASGQTPNEEELVSLNPDHPAPAYHMGRLLAALQKTQEEALPGTETIRRHFSSASASPSAVFPRLIRLHRHHLEKLADGTRNFHEKLVQAICQKIDRFPGHLDLTAQGLFALGYYHQRQDMFTSKKTETNETPEEAHS